MGRTRTQTHQDLLQVYPKMAKKRRRRKVLNAVRATKRMVKTITVVGRRSHRVVRGMVVAKSQDSILSSVLTHVVFQP